MNMSKKILILGAGMMSEPLLDYLLKREENLITVATNILEEGENITKGHPRCIVEKLDVANEADKLFSLVESHDLVLSYVPHYLHSHVANACLVKERHMITSSYEDDYMRTIKDQILSKDLIFMNEIGLDPGIDHIITHKVINEAKARGDKVVSFESWCGALPAPEFANNPFSYKFSWSPKAALLGAKCDAKVLLNNKLHLVPEKDLLKKTVQQKFHKCFQFEGYYNKDSIRYREFYGLYDAETIIRGTLRYKGYNFLLQCYKNLGLMSSEKISEVYANWKDYLVDLLKDKEIKNKIFTLRKKYFKNPINLFLASDPLKKEEKEFYIKLTLYAISKFDDEYLKENKHDLEENFEKFFASLKLLDFFDGNLPFQTRDSYLDAFSKELEEKLKMDMWENDLIYLYNEFVIKTLEGKILKKKYELLVQGNYNGMRYSALALLVGIPTGVVAQLILDNKIQERGLIMPSSQIIIDSIFQELEKLKIFIQEVKTFKAKF